jgi:hypothetical protein
MDPGDLIAALIRRLTSAVFASLSRVMPRIHGYAEVHGTITIGRRPRRTRRLSR